MGDSPGGEWRDILNDGMTETLGMKIEYDDGEMLRGRESGVCDG